MSLVAAGILAGVALVLAIGCGWMGARPAKALGAPRLVPWRMLMLIAFAVMVAALGHVVAVVKGG